MSTKRSGARKRAGSFGGRPDLLEQLVAALGKYVDFAEANVETAELRLRPLLAEGGPLGVKKSTYYAHMEDPRVKQYAERLQELKRVRDSGRKSVASAIAEQQPIRSRSRRNHQPEAAPSEALDAELLTVRYAQVRQQALAIADQLQGRLRRPGHVSSLPALAYHLDRTRSRLSALLVEANELREQWLRFAGASEGSDQMDLLSLETISPTGMGESDGRS